MIIEDIHPPKLRWQWNTNQFEDDNGDAMQDIKNGFSKHMEILIACDFPAIHVCELGGVVIALVVRWRVWGMFQGYVGKFLESMLEKLGSISIDFLFCKASRVFFFVPWISWQVNHHPSFFDLPHTYIFSFFITENGGPNESLQASRWRCHLSSGLCSRRVGGKKNHRQPFPVKVNLVLDFFESTF